MDWLQSKVLFCQNIRFDSIFGQLREQGARNNHTSAQTFEVHFKTLLLNNFVTVHSLHANCEN